MLTTVSFMNPWDPYTQMQWFSLLLSLRAVARLGFLPFIAPLVSVHFSFPYMPHRADLSAENPLKSLGTSCSDEAWRTWKVKNMAMLAEGENSINFTNVLLTPQGISVCVCMYICNKNWVKYKSVKAEHLTDMPTTLRPTYFTYEKTDWVN